MSKYIVLSKETYVNGDYSLVPIRVEDRYDIMKWRNEQIYHLRQNKPLTVEDQDNYFDNVVAKLFDKEKPSQLLFSFLKENTCIGYGGLVHINWIDKNAEISFIMNTALEKEHFNEFWSQYLKLIEQIGFDDLNLHKVFTYAFDIRPHLYPVLFNNGYQHEATLKEHCQFGEKFKNVVINTKIKSVPYLRRADICDEELTYKWANNKIVRKYAFNQNTIEFENHASWFRKKLSDENCIYYILCLGNQKLGSVRVDVDFNHVGLISYLIAPEFHGKGYGILILEKFEKVANLHHPSLKKITGKVLSENNASIKIFQKLNYKEYEKEGNLVFEKNI